MTTDCHKDNERQDKSAKQRQIIAFNEGFGYGVARQHQGEMAERFKAHAWKACWG